MTDRRDILTTALELIDGDRARTYGPPEVGFQRTADLWTAMGFRMEGRPLTAVDVSLALTQLKVSRIIGQPDHEDSWIDGPGYLALGGEIALAVKRGPDDEEIPDGFTLHQAAPDGIEFVRDGVRLHWLPGLRKWVIPVTVDPSGTWSWDANGTPLPMTTEAEWAAAGWTRKGGAG